MNIVDIVVPVYSGYRSTVLCLESLLECSCTTPFEIIVVYDAGPEPELRSYIHGLAESGRITLLENKKNLGFVASANRGMRLHQNRDVVLLNSDTQVAGDWLDRILECAASDSRIATVTPFSNNAEICSFPELCRYNPLPDGWSAHAIDKLFASAVSPSAIEVPTAIGFCMWIRRRAIEEVGEFNEELFGRGYGEENDFSRRAVTRGWRNVLCTNVFVYHEGGVSFGAEKQRRIENAMRVIDGLYPDYHALVHRFIREDPPKKYRIQAQLAAMRPGRPRILMVTHNLEGGTLRHVRELSKYVSDKAYVFVLRMQAPGCIQLAMQSEMGSLELTFGFPVQQGLLFRFLKECGIDRVHIHHVKGVERLVADLLQEMEVPYDVTLHDYYFINGNPTLSDKNGRYCAEFHERDRVCAEHCPVPLEMTPEQWRAVTGPLLLGAQRVFSPSHYAAAIYEEYFPGLNITVQPHPDWEMEAPYPPVRRRVRSPGQPLVVGVLGALGLEKGADVLEQTALLASKERRPVEFHLLGYAYRKLEGEVIEHGAYRDAELPRLLDELNPHLIWFPCQWPETYSYTLSACLRGGFPVLAPAIGAFVERMEERPLSWLQPFPSTPEQWLEKIVEIAGKFEKVEEDSTFEWHQIRYRYSSNYRQDYVLQAAGVAGVPDPRKLLVLMDQVLSHEPDLSTISRKEKLLRALIRLRTAPGVGRIMRTVPFAWQRRVKRLLSDKPLHEVGGDLLG